MNINPELILEAAKIARPEFEWQIGSMSVFAYHPDGGAEIYTFFSSNKLLNDHCQVALERALKKDGWEFSYERDEFQASREHSKPIMVGGMPGQEISTELLSDESDTMLLLLVVSAMTNIPMSTGGGE